MVRSLKPLRILVLVHPELVPPDSLKGLSDKEIHVFKTEYDVVSTLKARGHDVRPQFLGARSGSHRSRQELLLRR